jgi:hypothetical protein
MLFDLNHVPGPNGAAQVYYFSGLGQTLGHLTSWSKPRGKSMIDILLVGPGGNGGAGAIGANSTAAGGGGGGSGGQTRLTMPLHLLPDTLYLSVMPGGSNTTSRVSISPTTTANDQLIIANAGGSGGAAAGATAGAAGAAGAIATVATMPLGWAFATALAGQAGIIGGTTVAGGALTLPLTGLLVTGGTGGGGLPAAATAGTNGGLITAAGSFLGLTGGIGATAATTPAGSGTGGYLPIPNMPYGYGGTGGGSTHGSATGAGLVQSSGGNGAPGCGGGGSGGALTGSTAGVVGQGGRAFCIITVW